MKEIEKESRRKKRRTKESGKRKNGRRFGWLLAAFAVVAVACLVFAWLHRGELILSPTYMIESTSEMSFGQDGQTVVIDNGKQTLLLLDAEGKLIRRYDGGSDETPFYYAAYVVQAPDNSIYVADLKYGDRGLLLDWERIIRLDGEESQVVYEIDYSLWAEDNTPMQYGRILELQEYDGSVYFLIDMVNRIDLKKIGPDGAVQDLGSVPAEGVKTDASYDVKTGQVVVISRNGQVTVYPLDGGPARPAKLDKELMPFDIAARNGQVYYTEIQDLVVRHFPIDDPAADGEFASLEDILFKLDVSSDGQNVLATNQAGFYRLSVGADGEYASADYVDSAPIADFYRSVITWIALAVGVLLALFVLFHLLRFLIPRIAENETAMRAILIVLAALAVAFIVSSSLLKSLLTSSTDASKTQLELFTQYLLSRMDVDVLKKIDSQENFNDENFIALHEQLSGPVKESYENGQYYYYVIYRERNGFFRAVTDSEKSSPCWTPVYENEGNDYANVLHTGKSVSVSEISAYGAWAFQLTPIRDNDGSIIGVLEVGQSLVAVEQRQNEIKREVIVSTAIGTIVVAMLLIELAFLVGFIQKRKKSLHPDTTDLVPVRTIMFLSYLADAMQDAFIAILCSQLYKGGLPVPDGVAIALPMSLQLLMMALFSLMAGRLTEKLGSRRSISIGMAIEFSGFLICLLMGSYWGLLFGKMLIGAGMGIIYVGCNTVSATGGTEEKVSAAFAGVSAGTLSGVTIGAGLSSVLLTMGGWHLIYLAGCIIVGIGLILALTSGNVMPLKTDKEVPEAGRMRLREFLFSRRVLGFFILMLVPFMMSLSYREYFFPLFAQENGIDEVRIGQIYLLCGIMVIYIGPALSSLLLRKLGAGKSVVLASAVVGLDMLIFIIHPSLISVIIGVVIVSVVSSFAYTCQYTYVEQLPESAAYSEGRAMGVYSVFESLGQTIGPVAYGGLLAFGYRKGISIFCGAMFALIVVFLLLQWKKQRVKT